MRRHNDDGRRRSLALFALAALLPTVILSLVLVRMASSAVRDEAQRHVTTSARASANAVEQQLSKLAEIVDIYSELPRTEAVMTGTDAERQAVVRSLFEDPSDISLSFIVDEDGVLLNVMPETPEAIGVDFSFRDWYRGVASTQEVYVSEAFQPQTDIPLTVTVVAPIQSVSGRTTGYIGIGLTLDDLQSYVNEFAADQDVLLTVTDQAGVIVAAPGAAPRTIEALTSDEAVAAALRGMATLREIERGGEVYLSATRPVDGFGWTVTAEVAEGEALAARTSIITVAVVLMSVIAVFVIAVIVWLSRLWRRQDLSSERRRESDAFLEQIIENIPSAVTVKDASDLTFVRANPAALELLATDAETLIGSSVHVIADEAIADRQQAADRRVIAGRRTVSVDAMRLADQFGGRVLNVRQIPMVGSRGTVDYLLEIADDVTELVESIDGLERAWAEAQEANEAKSEFLSRMSHELRTPLNAVLGFGQLLELDDLSSNQAEAVQQILRGGRHLLGLINEVLDISRIESGNLSLSLEPVAIGDLLSETIELIRPLARSAQVEIPEGVMPDWDVWARADQQRLRQVMLNLLSNAVKYNRKGGSISVRCRTVGDSKVRIAVADTGQGLSEDQVRRLFSPFERLGAEGLEVEGTGLGLALTKRLVEAMHGAIGVETELGIGSTFWVELVASDESDLATGAPVASIGSERSDDVARLLHVEDSLDQLRWVEGLVAAHPDIELISIADAETAMDMAVRYQPDVVLLDLGVTGVDAGELVERMSADDATASIVIVTIGDDPSDLPGVRQHLMRPISDEALLLAITDTLAVARAMFSA